MASSSGSGSALTAAQAAGPRFLSQRKKLRLGAGCLAPDHPAGKRQSQRRSPDRWLQAPPSRP